MGAVRAEGAAFTLDRAMAATAQLMHTLIGRVHRDTSLAHYTSVDLKYTITCCVLVCAHSFLPGAGNLLLGIASPLFWEKYIDKYILFSLPNCLP